MTFPQNGKSHFESVFKEGTHYNSVTATSNGNFHLSIQCFHLAYFIPGLDFSSHTADLFVSNEDSSTGESLKSINSLL